MPTVNPGPSITQTPNTVDVMTPVNTSNNPAVQGSQGLRLLGVVKGLSVATVGDPALMTIINATTWVPTIVITANANVTMATATVGLYTAAAAGGTAVLTVAALTGQTTNAFAYVRAATAIAAAQTAQTLFVNVGVAVATGTVDLYLYGYDLSA